MIDQVPELSQTKSLPLAGTAATAEPVSWLAGRMTGIRAMFSSSATAGESVARTVPGWTISGKMWVGIFIASSSGVAQPGRRGS